MTLADLAAEERRAFALVPGRLPDMPQMDTGDQLGAALGHLDERDSAAAPDQRNRRIYLDHRQPPASRGDRTAFSGVGLLPGSRPREWCTDLEPARRVAVS